MRVFKLNDAAGSSCADHHGDDYRPQDAQEEGAGEEPNDIVYQGDIHHPHHDDHPHDDALDAADQHDTRVCRPDPRDDCR
jgi:hypothetical protein